MIHPFEQVLNGRYVAYAAVKKANEAQLFTFGFEENALQRTCRPEIFEKVKYYVGHLYGNQRIPFKMMGEMSIEIPMMKTHSFFLLKNR